MGHEIIAMAVAELRGSKRERIAGTLYTVFAFTLGLGILATSIVGIWYLGHRWGIW